MKAAQPKALVYFRSLGCPKNQVDSEVMLGELALAGYAIAQDIEDADVAVINTCSFIESARQESIDAILDVAALRERGDLRSLVVAGCLPQRYGDELAKELPEADAFVGTSHFHRIVKIIEAALEGRSPGVYVDAGRTHLYTESEPRLLIGGRHSAYLKIAEGCDRVCAFCAIPSIRGRFQSRTVESILKEAHTLGGEGVREVNVISQDTTSYGKDLYGRPRLAELVGQLDQVESLDWIRLLYLYPSAVNKALIDVLADCRRVLPYVDVPLQHASDPILRAMKRGLTAEKQRRLIETLRERIPDVVLRTTFIVGFPGETESDFAELLDFVRESRFDRMGVFRYSDEEGTTALGYAKKLPREVAEERYHRLMQLQGEIMGEKLVEYVGREERVLVDRCSTENTVARLWSQAPEIDGVVWLDTPARVGDFVRVQIRGVRDVDLEGQVLPGAAPRH
jgi:ribosomal protein S12 methylthiotransferase